MILRVQKSAEFRLEERQAEDTDLREEVDELLFWCDETESLLATSVDPSSRSGVTDLLHRITVSLLFRFIPETNGLLRKPLGERQQKHKVVL